MLGASKLPPNLNYNQIANINDEEFFFCVTFPKFEFQCCCGLSLRTGSIIIALFYVLCSGFSFYLAKDEPSMVNYISSITLLSVYSLAFLFIVISAVNFSYKFAYMAYILYCLVLLLSFIEILIVSTLMIAGKMNLTGTENQFIKAASFFLFGTLLAAIFLYLTWMIFCYVMHLKYNRTDLVCGRYGQSSKPANDSNQIGSGDANGFKII